MESACRNQQSCPRFMLILVSSFLFHYWPIVFKVSSLTFTSPKKDAICRRCFQTLFFPSHFLSPFRNTKLWNSPSANAYPFQYKKNRFSLETAVLYSSSHSEGFVIVCWKIQLRVFFTWVMCCMQLISFLLWSMKYK